MRQEAGRLTRYPARYRATLAYNGSAYQGFQRQKGDIPTIQAAVEQAIAEITGQQVTIIGAGRTDTGVHATGQVIAFDVEWKHSEAVLMRAINARLPEDIALQDIDIPVQADFHPRYDARSRRYRYRVVLAKQRQPLVRDFAWCVLEPIKLDLMQQCAALIQGEHDFATFGHPPKGNNTVRTVDVSEWVQEASPFGEMLTYTVEANAFLYHMVRRLVGMMVDTGRGFRTFTEFETAFRAADIKHAGTIAPPQGLVLDMVRYH